MPQPLRILSPIHKAYRQIAEHLNGPVSEMGLANAEAHLLTYLRGYGPCAISELGRVFGHPPSTLTGLLDRLEGKGLVRRTANPEDRRSLLVAATAEGVRVAALVTERLDRFEAEVLGRIRPADLDGFRAVMDAVDAVTGVALREEPGGTGAAGSQSTHGKGGENGA